MGAEVWQRQRMQTHCLDCHHVWIGQAIIPPGWAGSPIVPDCPKCGCEWTEAHEQHDWQPAYDPRYSICKRCHAQTRHERSGE